jgi:hypothetical protein
VLKITLHLYMYVVCLAAKPFSILRWMAEQQQQRQLLHACEALAPLAKLV